MEGEQISSVVTSNGPAPVLSDSEGSVHQYPVMYAAPGVVRKRDGRWGAYLCARDEHFWLGSFDTEEEAASEAQQKACIEFRYVDSNTPQYQYHRRSTTDEVYSMAVDSSYVGTQVREQPDSAAVPDALGLNLRQLFVKVLTHSDAGKLNRLVIPRRYAIKHFPLLSKDGGATKDTEVVFYDRSMKPWKFRYCYWRSSQSYVFTRGWSGFLKEKFLQPNDAVIFSVYGRNDGSDEAGKRVYVIDVAYDDNAGAPLIPDINDNRGDGILLMLPAAGHRNEYIGGMDEEHGFDYPMIPGVVENREAFPTEYAPTLPAASGGRGNEEDGKVDAHHGVEEKKGVKLFGVNLVRGG